MRRGTAKGAIALLAATPILGGCVGSLAALSPQDPYRAAAPGCATEEVAIAFDFEGAAPARCVIEGPRSIGLLIVPEHAPPINPSPWYAFRYRADHGAPVTVTLRYLEAKHRYAPKLTIGETTVELAAVAAEDGRSARLGLPGGQGIVSAQPIVSGERHAAFALRLERDFAARRITLGRSLDGRLIEGLQFGNRDAPRLIVLLGRQHPPEVTGHYAMEPFVEELAARLKADPALARRYQVLAVPLLNPDGIALGHWRANRGGVDLNRDWGLFTQPETRAVRDHLTALPETVHPVAMIDFHSTWRNLFYVQGEEATAAQNQFVTDWLGGKEKAYSGYPFAIVRSNANPTSGTAKNWFHATFGIPAITYEVDDNAARLGAEEAASNLARDLLPALDLVTAQMAER
jgi:hypothetical protein